MSSDVEHHRICAVRVRLAVIALVLLVSTQAMMARSLEQERPASNGTAAEAVVKRCADIYHSSGHPCACPSDSMRNGQACGHRSAHDKPGGASPVCSVEEVTPDLLVHPAEVEERCHYHGR